MKILTQTSTLTAHRKILILSYSKSSHLQNHDHLVLYQVIYKHLYFLYMHGVMVRPTVINSQRSFVTFQVLQVLCGFCCGCISSVYQNQHFPLKQQIKIVLICTQLSSLSRNVESEHYLAWLGGKSNSGKRAFSAS